MLILKEYKAVSILNNGVKKGCKFQSKRNIHIWINSSNNLKTNTDLANAINLTLEKYTFSETSKQSKVTPVCKKLGPWTKEAWRPVSLLPHVPKFFERII